MFTMSPVDANAEIGVKRLLILCLKEDAKSKLRPIDISAAMPAGIASGGRPLVAI